MCWAIERATFLRSLIKIAFRRLLFLGVVCGRGFTIVLGDDDDDDDDD